MPLFHQAPLLGLLRAAVLAALFLPSPILAQAPVHPTGPIVTDRRNVTYVGLSTDSGVEKFFNIPYGLDTSFGRRFKSPEPAFLREGTVYDATKKGPVCPQPVDEGVEMSEDCLKLMIVRPTHGEWWTEGKKLPVMVWIHGGGLFDGSMNDGRYDPEEMVLQSVENKLPIIVVAMNYRLNIFGYASSLVLKQSQDLNVGLKDQRLALEWVRDNIRFWNGDPERVTVFGQSSGGFSVALQMLAYGGKKGAPFHSAIMQSTSLQPAVSSSITRDAFTAIAKKTGCDSDGRADPQTSVMSLRCLRELEMSELLEATIAYRDSMSDKTDGDIFLPTIDGRFFPKSLSELTRRGMFVKMPVMIGWTEDDAAPFTPGDKDTREFLHVYFPDLSDATIDRILDLYPEEDFTGNTQLGLKPGFYRSSRIMRDILFVCPSFFFGWGMAKKYWEGNNLVFPPVYFYEFDQTIMDESGFGVVHSSDLPYVFANFDLYQDGEGVHVSEEDEELGKKVSRTWSAFANVGVPSLPPDTSRLTLEGWEGAYSEFGEGGFSERAEGRDEMMDGKVYVIGGSHSGMGTLEEQKLKERCGFLNTDVVLRELKY